MQVWRDEHCGHDDRGYHGGCGEQFRIGQQQFGF